MLKAKQRAVKCGRAGVVQYGVKLVRVSGEGARGGGDFRGSRGAVAVLRRGRAYQEIEESKKILTSGVVGAGGCESFAAVRRGELFAAA